MLWPSGFGSQLDAILIMVRVANTMTQQPLMLKFVGALVEQLGAQLYPSATATVAELISNAWDADANNVWVRIPFGRPWTVDDSIEVLDDGHGMTRQQAQQQYLIVGRKRRLQDGGFTSGGRPVHGRKGIGKLAAFGTAEILDCYTVQDGKMVSFRLDYDEIRRAEPGADCEVEETNGQEPLAAPDSSILPNGTRIRLSRLRLKRAISEDRFMKSMSRRFAIDQTVMRVFINGEQLQRFDMDLEFRFPKDGRPTECSVQVGPDGWGTEELPSGKKVRWWIGFTPKPLEAEYLRGISVLGRGKMLQRPFMFERAQGVRGQLGQEYVVGEVVANWLDTGVDIEDDVIQTNRDQLRLEDDRVQELLQWGRDRLNWALSQRQDRRQKKAEESMETPDITELLTDFTATERRHLRDIAMKAAKIGDPDPDEIHAFMVEVVNGFKDRAVRELMERVQVEDEGFQNNFWGLVREFSLIDARRNYSIIQARLETIERLDIAIRAGATEVPEIHNIIKEFPWLLDPRWSLLGDEVNLHTLTEQHESTVDPVTSDRLDFLFILRPKAPAPLDELLVVEIKRGHKSDGSEHRVSASEVHKFHAYVLAVKEEYSNRSSTPPSVNGLMIANGYTMRAKRIKTSLQGVLEVKLEFQTWNNVIENTRRLHTGWLEITRASRRPLIEQNDETSREDDA